MTGGCIDYSGFYALLVIVTGWIIAVAVIVCFHLTRR